MRWLKSLVIVLGILIVLGVVLLGFGFYKKTTDPDWKLFGLSKQETAQEMAPSPSIARPQKSSLPLKPFGNISLNLPVGCTITKLTPERRLVFLEIGPTPQCNRVVIVDLSAGIILGSVSPNP